jgi:hypothetical protein
MTASSDYPIGPGHRGIGGSVAAAVSIAAAMPHLQAAVLGIVAGRGAYGATSDEIADALGWDRFRVRPRASELRASGKIMDSRRRRKSASGILSIVWILPEYSQPIEIGRAA